VDEWGSDRSEGERVVVEEEEEEEKVLSVVV
jgi:hypothetical protein